LVRLDKLPQRGIAEDSRIASEIEQLFEKYQTRRRDNLALGVFDHELEQYRWMLEEYRVSSFAQGLGTSISVSPQRLEKQWDKALRSIAQSGS
jgi:ATP-dependent helicase HrpA